MFQSSEYFLLIVEHVARVLEENKDRKLDYNTADKMWAEIDKEILRVLPVKNLEIFKDNVASTLRAVHVVSRAFFNAVQTYDPME